MVKALFDTNILLDYLNAIPAAKAELSLYQMTLEFRKASFLFRAQRLIINGLI